MRSYADCVIFVCQGYTAGNFLPIRDYFDVAPKIEALLIRGAAHEDILSAYPQLNHEAIEEALRYAARMLKHDSYLTA